jgi:hypothetical protein
MVDEKCKSYNKSVLLTACDPHCVQCSTNLFGKCDPGYCLAGYGYSATTQTCVRKYSTILPLSLGHWVVCIAMNRSYWSYVCCVLKNARPTVSSVTSLAPAAVTRASVLLDSITRQRLRAVLVSNALSLILLLAAAEG